MLPHNEAERLDVLYQLNILDSAPEADFDGIVQLAAFIAQTQQAAIHLIDVDRQWCKAALHDSPDIKRQDSLCAQAIFTPNAVTYLSDLSQHTTVSQQHSGSYFAVPLCVKPDLAIGTLCVSDPKVQTFSTQQQQGLQLLANQVVTLLQQRLTLSKLSAQQQTLENISLHVPLLLAQLDPFLRYQYCNQHYADWLAQSPTELLGQPFTNGSLAASLFTEQELQHALQGKRLKAIYAKPHGRILDIALIPNAEQAEKVTSLLLIATDKTEQHNQQLTTQQERDRLDAIIHGTNLGTWEWNIQTGKTVYNQRWLNILGLDPHQETDVELWRSLLHPSDRIQAEALLAQHFSGDLPFYDVRFRMRHVDGHWIWIHAVGKVMSWDLQGNPLLMFGTHTDITHDMARENEMLATRSWLQAIVDSSTEVAMISTDPSGVIQLFNTGAERMLGYQAREVVGLHTPSIFHDSSEIKRRAEQLSSEYQQTIQGFEALIYRAKLGINETRQWTYLCKNGELKQVRLSVSMMRNQAGDPLGYLGVAIDITQLEQLNHALLLSEQRHRSMLENLPGVVYRCINDEAWTMLFISDEVEKLTGYPAKSFIRNKQINFDLITFADDRQGNRQRVEAQLKNHARFSVEYRIYHANGELRWVQELGRGIFDQQNQLLYIDGFIWDITAQKEAQLKLRASEQKLSSLYQLAPVAIVLTSFPQNMMLEANPALQQMLGYSIDELLQQPFTHIVSEDDHPQLDQQLKQLQEYGRFGPQQLELEHQQGQRISVVQSGILIESLQGELQIWSIIQDITEQKRIEQMKNQFVSMVSHELRTPLTAISGALGLIGGGALGSVPVPMEKMLTIALENSHKLGQLINDLLDIDKLVAGKMQFKLSRCTMLELLQQSILHNQPYADKYQASIELIFDAAAERAQVVLDPMRFQQVMANLLSNAAKFSPLGSIIKVTLTQTEDTVKVAILDQGSGISPEFQQRMFEKFSQADSADARSKDGTGLGLAIVKELTERMQGRISFDTELGKGTCFYLHFPKAEEESR